MFFFISAAEIEYSFNPSNAANSSYADPFISGEILLNYIEKEFSDGPKISQKQLKCS